MTGCRSAQTVGYVYVSYICSGTNAVLITDQVRQLLPVLAEQGLLYCTDRTVGSAMLRMQPTSSASMMCSVISCSLRHASLEGEQSSA